MAEVESDIELVGLGGWLSLVMIGLFFGAMRGLNAFAAPSWLERSIDAVVGIGSAALFVLMVRLSPRAPQVARIFFCVLGVAALGTLGLAVAYSGGAELIGQSIGSAVSAGIWFQYFRRSRRVALTFPPPRISPAPYGGGATEEVTQV